MYAVVVTMQVLDERRPEFERLIGELADSVRQHERENIGYHLLRSRSAPCSYRIVEIYNSKEAFKLHLGAEYVRKANGAVQATLQSAAQMEVVDALC